MSPRLHPARARKRGAPPGTLVHVGDRKAERVQIRVAQYDAQRFTVREIARIAEVLPLPEAPMITWIDVAGLHDVETVAELGRALGLHELVIEDVLSTDQRTKLDEHEGYAFLVTRALLLAPRGHVDSEQVSFVLAPRLVVSFQERPLDLFEAVFERLRTGRGTARKHGADFLAYALLDAIVDQAFEVLDALGQRIDQVEEKLAGDPRRAQLLDIHRLKRDLLHARKVIWPLREIVGELSRGECSLFEERTHLFLRDVQDHAIQAIELLEINREMVSEMVEIWLSSVSNKLNEVMKVLTVVTTVFIPLNLIAGVYGMNFKHMPELEWRWGYPAALLLMAAVATALLLVFRRKRWM